MAKAAKQPGTPTHVGFILDGNRRWAKAHGVPTLEGHRQGYENLKTILFHTFDKGIRYASLFVFSTENWNRSVQEVNYLMKLLSQVLTNELQELHSRNVRIVWMGSRQRMSRSLIRSIEHAEAVTRENTDGTLVLCLNHGGHREIAEAVQRLVADRVGANEINEAMITRYLEHPEIPPIDLVIRTSGEQRLSNFMLWRTAYSELIFRDELWPDFSTGAFDECLLEYSKRQRRFGG